MTEEVFSVFASCHLFKIKPFNKPEHQTEINYLISNSDA